jgi:hypothetical protein
MYLKGGNTRWRSKAQGIQKARVDEKVRKCEPVPVELLAA